MIPAIVSFSAGGAELALKVATITGGRVSHCGFNGEDARVLLPRLFAEGRPIVGICAAGILIRLLAPHLEDKSREPPVLAVSQDGASVVPLLGGHRGANQLARQIAEALGAQAALTTASDSRFDRGLDEPPPGWVLSATSDAKPAMLALLAGAKIVLDGYAPWIAEAGYPVSSMGAFRILVTEQKLPLDRGLVYHPKTLVAGVGCERGTDADEVIELIQLALARENLSPQSLAAIATIDIKADEAGLHAAAARFGVPLRLFSAAELNQERYRLTNPSAVVEAEVGTPSVSEAAALKAGMLVVPKLKSQRATCAIGRATRPIAVEALGRPHGILHVVGVGPGRPSSRTQGAIAALDAASDWVGYGLYLDLIGDLRLGQAEHRFELGEEEARVRHALELAGTGRIVALVCSGDAQIYAMASLVYELVEARGERAVSDAARRVAIDVHPGISAFQAASAAAGSLVGHDFCCISLSDLLTPRDEILRRLEHAVAGGFVIALYNPRSKTRTDLFADAKARLLFHVGPDTPVVVARNLGRPDERVEVVELARLAVEQIDMLTIVLVGSKASRAFRRGSGRVVAYTPRGYANRAIASAAQHKPVEPAELPVLQEDGPLADTGAAGEVAPTPQVAGPEPVETPPLSESPFAEAPPAAEGAGSIEPPVPPAALAPPAEVRAATGAIRAGVAFLRNRVRAAGPPSRPPEDGSA